MADEILGPEDDRILGDTEGAMNLYGAAALLGSLSDEEMLGRATGMLIRRAGGPGRMVSLPGQAPMKAAQAINKQTAPAFLRAVAADTPKPVRNGGVTDSRAELQDLLPMLPAEIRNGLMQNRLQALDHTLFWARRWDGNTDLIRPSDAENISADAAVTTAGLVSTNVSQAMLPQGKFFILSAIQMQIEAVADATLLSAVPFGTTAALPPQFINGWVEAKQNSKFLQYRSGLEPFGRSFNAITNKPNNYWKLATPKILVPQTVQEFKLFVAGTPIPGAGNSHIVKLMYHGSIITAF